MPIQKTSKEEIIQKSITVFRQKGYYRTSMSDLAKHCNLTKGAFYHHFSSKEEVMMKSLEVISSWFKENIFAIGYAEDVPAEERLRTMMEVYAKTFFSEKGGCIFGNTVLETVSVEDTFRAVTKDFFESWKQSLVNIFVTKYAPTIAKSKSEQVIANLQGAIVLAILQDDTRYLKDAIKRSEEIL